MVKALKWTASVQPYVVSTCGGKSAGVAAAVKNHIGLSKPTAAGITEQYQTPGRFVIRRMGAIRKVGCMRAASTSRTR